MAVLDDAGNGRDDEENVAEESNRDGDTDSLVATPPCVGDVGTEKRNDIHPEHRMSLDAAISRHSVERRTRRC